MVDNKEAQGNDKPKRKRKSPEQQIRDYKERIKAIEAKQRAQKRKNRDHALMVIGGLVLSYGYGGDWTCVDWDKLSGYLQKYGYKIAECKSEKLDPIEAGKRLREWEAAQREAARAAETETDAEADSEVEIVTDDGGDSGYELATDGQPQPQQNSYLNGWGGR